MSHQKKPKTFRDLQKEMLTPIAIGRAQTKPKTTSDQEDVLDLSMIHNKESVIESRDKRIVDISRKKSSAAGMRDGTAPEKKEEKFMFVEVSDEKPRSQQKLTELIKLAAAGTLILFSINVINIYQRGVTIKNDVIATAFSGYDNLLHASSQSKDAQFADAQNSFTASTKDFGDALNTLRFLETNQNVFYTREKTVESVQNLLEAGKNISEAGTDFAKGIQHLQDLPALVLKKNSSDDLSKIKPTPVDESTITPSQPLTDILQQDLVFLQKSSGNVAAASQNLSLVSPDVLPEQMKSKLETAKTAVSKLQEILQEAQDKMPVLMKLLGQRYMQRYLILLQNDAEARPTGGFIGSYLIVDVNNGYVINTEFHDIYETDGQLKEDIPAPEDIAQITKNWRMRDSNYSPDFAVSAEKAAWFLQKENGPSVDSVIAINQHFIGDLFDVTGPVQLDGLKAPLTKDNYSTVISYLVESKASGNDDPKKILRSFIPAFQKQLMSSKNIGKIVKLVIDALKNRDVMLYSRDEDIQNFFDQMDVSGRVIRTKPNEDFLQVISTSVGGNKSDVYIQQSITHDTFIAKDGSMKDEVTITRKHTWTTAELSRWKAMLSDFGYTNISKTLQYILGSGTNKSSIKVYVPEGATLLGTQGIDQTLVKTGSAKEIQKNYFMFTMNIPAGEEQTVTLSYKLPTALKVESGDAYKFFAQRQPGIVLSTLEKNIVVAQGIKIYESFPKTLSFPEPAVAQYKTALQNDAYVSALIGVE